MTFDWSSYAIMEFDGGKMPCVRERQPRRPNLWHFLGGKKNHHEWSPRDTLVREVYEETGIRILKHQPVLISKKKASVWKNKKLGSRSIRYKHYYDVYFYIVRIHQDQYLQRDPVPLEHEELRLFTRNEIDRNLDFAKSHRLMLREAIPIRHDGEELESV